MTWPLPPLLLRAKTGRWPALWVPVVLLWPLYFAAFALGFCVAMPLAAALRAPVPAVFGILLEAFRLLCALHGSELVLSTPTRGGSGDALGTWTLTLY